MGREVTRYSKRSRVAAVLAALLVASALWSAPGPAAATGSVADHLPVYTACPGEAIDPAGFVDVVGHFAEDAIDCLAHYGVTRGTSPGLYSPDSLITRWQMALFLVRAAGPAGITLPAVADQGFTDIDLKALSIRDAINQLAALGVMRGTSATTFTPDGVVTRRQMAVFLYRFLLASPVGKGGTEAGRVTPDDTAFEDVEDLPETTFTAVGVLHEMGVTTGTSPTTFSPLRLVTRAQMALFITRALDHTNARPAGLSVQTGLSSVAEGDTLDIQISARDDNHRPAAGGGLVDLFTTPAGDPKAYFDPGGACLEAVEVAFGLRKCRIDQFDRRLDESGNLSVVIEPTDDLVLWAWTGLLNTEFRLDTVMSGSVEIEVLKPAATLRVRDDIRRAARTVKMGEQITVVFQLVDDGGGLVEDDGVRVRITTTFEQNGVVGRTVTRTERTDQGQVTVSFQGSDPDPDGPGDSVALDLDVEVQALDVLDQTTLGVVGDDADDSRDVRFTWSEDAPEVSTLRLSQTATYHPLSGSGPGLVNLVRATLTDQYGGPVPDFGIAFFSDDPTGIGSSPVQKITDPDGIAVIRYLREDSAPATERVFAETDGGGVQADPIDHYWAVSQVGGGSALGVPIVVGDIRNDVIVFTSPTPILVRYDARDRFAIEGSAVSYENFEEALVSRDYAKLSLTLYSTDPEDVSSFELTNTRIFDDA